MEVKIHSNISGAIGVCIITTDPDHTVGSLIRTFCNEKDILRQSDFILTNCRQEILKRNRKLCSYGIQNGEELYLSVGDTDEWPCNCNQWWILAVVTFFIGVIGIVGVSYSKSRDYVPTYTYGVGLDAGSSHTNLYVYRWPTNKYNGTGIVDEFYSCSKDNHSMKAISSFLDNPSSAGDELRPCLDNAKRVVPDQELSRSPIFLGATGGMRLLRLSNQTAAEEIMNSVQETIKSYPFLIVDIDQQVRIIEGDEEGTFSWISTNFLSGRFGFQPMAKIVKGLNEESSSPMLGALDMGGASTQITFVPEHSSSLAYGNNETLTLYGQEYNIYTYSYQCYGMNEAYRRHLARLVLDSNFSLTAFDPCSQKDTRVVKSYDYIFQVPCTLNSHTQADPIYKGKNFTFVGKGDSASCRNQTMTLFNFTASCSFPSCSFNGVYQPPLFSSFLGFSGYYYLMNSLNLTSPSSSLDDFERARDNYCTYFQPASKFNYCFQAHYIYDILVDGYKFNDANWHSLSFQNQLNGAELGWILGMMINTTNIIPVAMKDEKLSLTVFILLVILFSVFLFLSVAFVCQARKQSRMQRAKYHSVSTTAYGAI